MNKNKKNIYICNLCKKTYYGEIGRCYTLNKKFKVYCKKCASKIENLSNLPEVMIISINPASFDLVKKKRFYFHPSKYSRKGGKYIAFYISKPISAITHIAKVKNILKNQKPKKYLKGINLDVNIKNIKVYLLDNFKKLNKPIIKGTSSPIQGSKNTTLKKIKKSKTLKELLSK